MRGAPQNAYFDLATTNFIARHDNVLLIGKTGVGKSHVAQAIGHRACIAGHNVLYTSAHDMHPAPCLAGGRLAGPPNALAGHP